MNETLSPTNSSANPVRANDKSMRTSKLYSRSYGKGPAVVLVHALGFDHTMWSTIVDGLSVNRQLICVDVRGHGLSEVGSKPFSLEEIADDIQVILDEHNIVRCDFIGLSMGGMIGQAFALGHPDRLNKLVLACTTSAYNEQARSAWLARIAAVKTHGMSGIVEMAMQRFFSPQFIEENPSVVATARRQFLSCDSNGYIACCDAISKLNFTDALSSIEAPTLVLSGALDVSTPAEMGELIARKIPGARHIVLPKAAHLAVAESPQLFRQLIADFLV